MAAAQALGFGAYVLRTVDSSHHGVAFSLPGCSVAPRRVLHYEKPWPLRLRFGCRHHGAHIESEAGRGFAGAVLGIARRIAAAARQFPAALLREHGERHASLVLE